MRLTRLAVPAALAAAGLAIATSATGTAAAATTIVTAKPVTLAAAPATSADLFQLVWPKSSAHCPRGAEPLAAGWSGPGAYVGEIDVLTGTTGVWSYELRRSVPAAPSRTAALCIRGAGRVTARTAKATVSCGRDIAVGLPVYYGSPSHGAGGSHPTGISKWRTDAGDHFKAKALCIPRRAFRSVRTAQAAGAVAAGAVTGRVTVTCPARHRAIGWGYRVAAIPGYQPPADVSRTSPYVSASHPAGARAWRVQFTTPDGSRATGRTPVRAYAVCAVPA